MSEPQRLSVTLETISATVRAIREQEGWSYRQAADQIGVSFTVLYGLETGRDTTLHNLIPIVRWVEAHQ